LKSHASSPGKIFFLAFILFIINSCYPARVIWYNYADINDYKKFPVHHLTAPQVKFIIPESRVLFETEKLIDKTEYKSLEEFLKKSNTVAFLIIKNDSVIYENYFNKYERNSVVPSFSMAKSYISALTGIAINEGLIKSIDQKVTDYLPELKENGFENVTIKHLLQMTSGIDFNENYKSPVSDASIYYYGSNLRKQVAKLKLKYEPGTKFHYASGNTQILALILEKVLKGKTITDYLNEKIWQPLGMEYDATWSIDSKKSQLEKAFCCINARAVDYAKFGMLYLNGGRWLGEQIITESWIEESTKADTENGSSWHYQYHWRMVNSESGEYYAAGWLGQFIYINPDKNILMVRLGKNFGGVNWVDTLSAFSKSIK
jgi:CubicO group peptidase (beta-lactamase class C family)